MVQYQAGCVFHFFSAPVSGCITGSSENMCVDFLGIIQWAKFIPAFPYFGLHPLLTLKFPQNVTKSFISEISTSWFVRNSPMKLNREIHRQSNPIYLIFLITQVSRLHSWFFLKTFPHIAGFWISVYPK